MEELIILRKALAELGEQYKRIQAAICRVEAELAIEERDTAELEKAA